MKTYLYVYEFKEDMEQSRDWIAELLKGAKVVFNKTHNTLTEDRGDEIIKHWFVSSSITPHALSGMQFDRVYIDERVTKKGLLDIIQAQRKDKS